ncbi:unnamed protein product [Blepharisma stoltei]|uniref:Myb-like DNA-binding domain containing protein n=1 Tax=Blepharisma stoltei TaxID=1481888 RepID=A0AAU9JA61_9CILI|nr:unnamed protein product [Blepharisma stoltei]
MDQAIRIPVFKQGKWSPEEDQALKSAVDYYGAQNWKAIADEVGQRTSQQCFDRYKSLKPGLIKGPWQPYEDVTLREWVKYEGPTGWSRCSLWIPGRSGKQCRERWSTMLNPGLIKRNWTREEESILFEMYKKYGKQWSLIAKSLPGRSVDSVRKHIWENKKKLQNQPPEPDEELSIDPDVSDLPLKKIFISKENASEKQGF